MTHLFEGSDRNTYVEKEKDLSREVTIIIFYYMPDLHYHMSDQLGQSLHGVDMLIVLSQKVVGLKHSTSDTVKV